MVLNVTVSSISIIPQPPVQPTQVNFTLNFTLNWDEPFANFDPILNYTIIITCSDAQVRPVMQHTGCNTTTLDISYDIPIIAYNYTISVMANNTVGSSEPAVIFLVGKLFRKSQYNDNLLCITLLIWVLYM